MNAKFEKLCPICKKEKLYYLTEINFNRSIKKGYECRGCRENKWDDNKRLIRTCTKCGIKKECRKGGPEQYICKKCFLDRNNFKCNFCNLDILRRNFQSHYFENHKDENVNLYREFVYEKTPIKLCKCGCEKQIYFNWQGFQSEYLPNHRRNTKPEIKNKIKKAFQKTWAENEKLGLHEKSKEIHRQLMKERLRNGDLSWRNSSKPSGLEIRFSKILEEFKINYETGFILTSSKGRIGIYDLKIIGTNILLEIDGDYWHINPKIYPRDKDDKRQQKIIDRDKFKDNLAAKRGYYLIRIWENDINNKTPEFENKMKELINMVEMYHQPEVV